MADLIGHDIGRYHIVERLGDGGMATVYKAYDTRLEREVAIKVIRTEMFGSALIEKMLKRFEREAKSLARLSHPNIIRIHDFGEYENSPFLVMEFVQGGTLKAYTSRTGAGKSYMPYARAAHFLAPIARALDYAHGQNIVHRDVKPANILISTSGEPMLSDFGVAKILDNDESTLTGTNTGVGTPEYMAPEQWENRITPAVDIYALGVVYYELVTGHKPYSADTPAAILRKQLMDPLPRPKSFVPDLPDEVEYVLFKALAKNPDDRYLNMAEFAAALDHLASQALTAVREVQPASVTLPAPSLPFNTLTEQADANHLPPAPLVPPDRPPHPPAEETMLERSASAPFPMSTPPAGPKNNRLRGLLTFGGLALVGLICIGALVLSGALFGNRFVSLFNGLSPSQSPTYSFSFSLLPTKTPGLPESTLAPTLPPVLANSNPQLKLALIAPLSGPDPTFGTSTREGFLMALDEWNAQGGVLGMHILPIIEDGQCAGDPGAAAANRVIDQDKVHYIIGEVCSKASIPISEIANAKNVVQISPTSTNPGLTLDSQGAVKPFIFRACFIDPFQGSAAASFAVNRLKAKTAFVMNDPDNDYVNELANAFTASFTRLGGKILGSGAYSGSTTDFSTILAKIAAARPDLVYLPDYYNVVNLAVKHARDKGITAPFLGGDGWDSTDLDLKAAEGSYFTNHYSPDSPLPSVANFVIDYRQKYKDDKNNPKVPDALAALAYDATNLMLQAIQDTGKDDPLLVKDTLANIKFNGVTGPITFDSRHNPNKSAVILKVSQGRVKYYAIAP